MAVIKNIMNTINKRIKLNLNSGFILRKIYGPTRLHSDGISSNITGKSNIAFIDTTNNWCSNMDNLYIRTAGLVFQLNDDYAGGLFRFPKYNIEIKLEKGSVIIFPPYWTHQHDTSELENNSYRYTVTTWACESV